MDSLMILPSFLVEKLEDEELILVNGGMSAPAAVNNGSGKCSGTNNSDGSCSGTNNGAGLCQATLE